MIKTFIKKIVDSIIALESFFTIPEKHAKKRVLILRKDTLGDYILFYPTLKAYRNKYIDAEITLVLSKLFQDLSPLLKDFDNIIWFDAKKFSTSFFYRRKFFINLKRAGFDISIQPTFSREPAGDLMMKITEAKQIIGVDGDCTASTKIEKQKNNTIYTKLITVPEEIIIELDKNKYIAEKITGQEIDINFPTIDISIFSDSVAKKIITDNNLTENKYVVFFPGSGTTFKIWPSDKFAEIADYFVEKGITPLLCGSKGEKDLILGIMEKMVNKNKVVDLSGKTDLPAMIHLLKSSKFYFGSDTGIAHISAAICVPVICIIGGGHFGRFFPYGDLTKNKIVFDYDMTCKNDNWMCSKNLKEGESSPCIKNIKVEDVKKEIDILINTL